MPKKILTHLALQTFFTIMAASKIYAFQSLDLNRTVFVPASNNPYVKVYVKKIVAPTNLNATGITGSITFTSTLPYIAQSAVAIWYSPNGLCPDEQTAFPDYQYILDNFPNSKNINFINLILSKPGTVTVPVTHQFSVKRPMTGCIFLTFDMAAAPNGTTATGGITTTTNMTLEYDTLDAPTPAPYAVPVGTEYCFGSSTGCVKATTCTNIDCAFATTYKINSPLILTDLFGDITAGPLNAPPYGTAPTSTWSAAVDFYVYKSCTDLPDRANGPADYYQRIPADATLLYHMPINSSGVETVNKPVSKKFAPISLEKGNCIVSLTKFFSPNGSVTVNAQVYGLFQENIPTTKSGDLNKDGQVNILDFNLLISKFGNPYSIQDFNSVIANFGK